MNAARAYRRSPRRLALDRLTRMGMGVAHDFNNLLAAIQGNAAVLSRELPPDSDAAACVEQIQLCSRRGLELTHQLLLFTGKAPFSGEPIDMSEVVRETIRDGAARAGAEHEMSLELASGLPRCSGDRSQIRDLLENLVVNAVEALEGREGSVTIATGAAEMSDTDLARTLLGDDCPAGRYVALSVSDTGRGIPRRLQPYLFDPFYTTKIRGQGLGLCIAAGVMRAHGGTIRVDSRAHRGTTVTAFFPAGQNKSS